MLLAESLLGSSSLGPVYIEDTFSTYLYTGNGSTQTITNGINLRGKGGLVWLKRRNGTANNQLFDTARGAGVDLSSNSTSQALGGGGLSSFLSNGFSLNSFVPTNGSGSTFASWTFRKQPKFFDVVTYTGNGANRTIAHSLGSVPGCIIVKRTNTTGDWQVYHRANTAAPETDYLVLNSTAATVDSDTRWNDTLPTSTVFSLGTEAAVNASGGTYVAYLFAHDAGGFGDIGTDNVISCGSYTGNGSATGPVVTLGYEPQWLLVKRTDSTGDWNLIDNLRGFVVGGTDAELNPNLTIAESTGTFVTPTATGFQLNTTAAGYNASGGDYIYIAIRRGPMRTPTSGTSVYNAVNRTGTGANATVNAGLTVDLSITARNTNANGNANIVFDRMRGANNYLLTTQTSAQSTGGVTDLLTSFANQTGVELGADASYGYINSAPSGNWINWYFRRAPGFFDVVCYTGTGANTTQTHNLGVVPELMIVKGRSSAAAWQAYSSALANTEYLVLNTTAAKAIGATRWNSTTPTSSVFSLGTAGEVNTSAATYVAYLFATLAGVSKVGSYTGTGATQTVNCGFATSARFLLIKRTDSTGDWLVWDTVRGISSLNDPYLRLNSPVQPVTNTDWVDPAATGFELSNAVGNLANTSGGSYIFLAIA
jgi:hypothetical protein